MVPTLAFVPRSVVSRRCISTMVMSGVCSTSPSRTSRCGSSLQRRRGDGAPFARRLNAPAHPHNRRGNPISNWAAARRAGIPPSAASITRSRKSWL